MWENEALGWIASAIGIVAFVFGAFRVYISIGHAMGFVERKSTPQEIATQQIVASLGETTSAVATMSTQVVGAFDQVAQSIERTEERAAARSKAIAAKLDTAAESQQRLVDQHNDINSPFATGKVLEKQIELEGKVDGLRSAATRIETAVAATALAVAGLDKT